jgi:hypothetical protein
MTACGRLRFDGVGQGAPPDSADAQGRDGADARFCAYQLCDDFEAPALASGWTPSATGVSLDSTVSHTGTSSVHFRTPFLGPNIGDTARLTETATIALGTSVYVRAFMRFGALPAVNNYGPILSVAENVGDFEDSVLLRATSLDIYNQWSDTAASNGAAPPLDTWLCVLWSVTRATTTTGAITLGGDLAPATLANVQTDGPPLTWLVVGITFYAPEQPSSQPAIDLWVDDVLVSDAPLSCTD